MSRAKNIASRSPKVFRPGKSSVPVKRCVGDDVVAGADILRDGHEVLRAVVQYRAPRQRGWRDMVFLVDDNFIGDKRRTKALLHEMIAWRKRLS